MAAGGAVVGAAIASSPGLLASGWPSSYAGAWPSTRPRISSELGQIELPLRRFLKSVSQDIKFDDGAQSESILNEDRLKVNKKRDEIATKKRHFQHYSIHPSRQVSIQNPQPLSSPQDVELGPELAPVHEQEKYEPSRPFEGRPSGHKNKKPVYVTISQQTVNGLLFLLLLFILSVCGSIGCIFIVSALTVIESLQTRGNCFLVSLALGQLLVTILVVPSSAIQIMAGETLNGRLVCHYQWLTLEFSLIVSQLSFLLIAADNYLGYNYSQKVVTCAKSRGRQDVETSKLVSCAKKEPNKQADLAEYDVSQPTSGNVNKGGQSFNAPELMFPNNEAPLEPVKFAPVKGEPNCDATAMQSSRLLSRKGAKLACCCWFRQVTLKNKESLLDGMDDASAKVCKRSLFDHRNFCGRLKVLAWIVLVWLIAGFYTYHQHEISYGPGFCTASSMISATSHNNAVSHATTDAVNLNQATLPMTYMSAPPVQQHQIPPMRLARAPQESAHRLSTRRTGGSAKPAWLPLSSLYRLERPDDRSGASLDNPHTAAPQPAVSGSSFVPDNKAAQAKPSATIEGYSSASSAIASFTSWRQVGLEPRSLPASLRAHSGARLRQAGSSASLQSGAAPYKDSTTPARAHDSHNNESPRLDLDESSRGGGSDSGYSDSWQGHFNETHTQAATVGCLTSSCHRNTTRCSRLIPPFRCNSSERETDSVSALQQRGEPDMSQVKLANSSRSSTDHKLLLNKTEGNNTNNAKAEGNCDCAEAISGRLKRQTEARTLGLSAFSPSGATTASQSEERLLDKQPYTRLINSGHQFGHTKPPSTGKLSEMQPLDSIANKWASNGAPRGAHLATSKVLAGNARGPLYLVGPHDQDTRRPSLFWHMLLGLVILPSLASLLLFARAYIKMKDFKTRAYHPMPVLTLANLTITAFPSSPGFLSQVNPMTSAASPALVSVQPTASAQIDKRSDGSSARKNVDAARESSPDRDDDEVSVRFELDNDNDNDEDHDEIGGSPAVDDGHDDELSTLVENPNQVDITMEPEQVASALTSKQNHRELHEATIWSRTCHPGIRSVSQPVGSYDRRVGVFPPPFELPPIKAENSFTSSPLPSEPSAHLSRGFSSSPFPSASFQRSEEARQPVNQVLSEPGPNSVRSSPYLVNQTGRDYTFFCSPVPPDRNLFSLAQARGACDPNEVSVSAPPSATLPPQYTVHSSANPDLGHDGYNGRQFDRFQAHSRSLYYGDSSLPTRLAHKPLGRKFATNTSCQPQIEQQAPLADIQESSLDTSGNEQVLERHRSLPNSSRFVQTSKLNRKSRFQRSGPTSLALNQDNLAQAADESGQTGVSRALANVIKSMYEVEPSIGLEQGYSSSSRDCRSASLVKQSVGSSPAPDPVQTESPDEPICQETNDQKFICPSLAELAPANRSSGEINSDRYMPSTVVYTYAYMKDERLLKSNIIAFLLSLSLWLPFIIMSIVWQYRDHLAQEVKDSVWWISTLNCCSCSYVYALTNRDFRDAFNKLFYYCCCKSHVTFPRRTPIFRRQLDTDLNGNLRVRIVPGLNVYSSKLTQQGGDPTTIPGPQHHGHFQTHSHAHLAHLAHNGSHLFGADHSQVNHRARNEQSLASSAAAAAKTHAQSLNSLTLKSGKQKHCRQYQQTRNRMDFDGHQGGQSVQTGQSQRQYHMSIGSGFGGPLFASSRLHHYGQQCSHSRLLSVGTQV